MKLSLVRRMITGALPWLVWACPPVSVTLAAAVGTGAVSRLEGADATEPQISEHPRAASSRVGGSAGFGVRAVGLKPMSYQWRHNGQPIAGATREYLAIPTVGDADAGTYTVEIANAVGRATSVPAALTVSAAPAVPIVYPGFRADAQLYPSVTGTDTLRAGISAMLPLPDGRVVVALDNTFASRFVRLLADGRIDSGFAQTPVSRPEPKMVLQPDGKILVVQDTFYRLNLDGSIDPSFSPPSNLSVVSLALQPDGKIVVLANVGRLLRLLPDGAVDPEFKVSVVGNGQSGMGAIALAGSGKIYRAMPYDGLKRVLSTGEPDLSFVSPLASSTSSPFLGGNSFRVYCGAEDRVFVDAITWTGSGGTSIAIEERSFQISADGRLGGSRNAFLSTPPAPDGTLLTSGSGAAPGFRLWAADGSTTLPMNWGVPASPETGKYRVAFGPDNTLWLGGDFSFYHGAASPRIVRLNRVASEATQIPLVVGAWSGQEAFSTAVPADAGSGATIFAGHTATLSVAVNSDGPVTYEWALDGVVVRRTRTPNLDFVPSRDGTIIWGVRALNSAGASPMVIASVNAAPAPLAIADQPFRLSAVEGRNAELRVLLVPGVAVLAPEWRCDGVLLPAANAATIYQASTAVAGSSYRLPDVKVSDAGTYTVTFSTSDGRKLTSAPIIVTVGDTSRFTNFSVRARVGAGEQAMTAGLVLPAGNARRLVLRGIGPTLANFGVTGALSDPTLEVYSTTSRIGLNADWGSSGTLSNSTFDAVGAFRLPAGSADAAFVTESPLSAGLLPGAYTLRLVDAKGTGGVGLLEVYEADNWSERIINMSARVVAGPADSPAIAGFTIAGPVPKRVLLRVAGPALSAFGVPGVLSDPRLELRDRAGRLIASNDDWQAQGEVAALVSASISAGAFAFAPGSRDAALVSTLAPGSYSVVATGAGAQTGVALIEIFEVP